FSAARSVVFWTFSALRAAVFLPLSTARTAASLPFSAACFTAPAASLMLFFILSVVFPIAMLLIVLVLWLARGHPAVLNPHERGVMCQHISGHSVPLAFKACS